MVVKHNTDINDNTIERYSQWSLKPAPTMTHCSLNFGGRRWL